MKVLYLPVLGTLWLLLAACTRAPALPVDASFDTFFQRLRSEPAFRQTRTERDWQAEHRQRVGFRTLAAATIPCGYVEIERNGWTLLPDDDALKASGASYRLPQDFNAGTAIVTLQSNDALHAQYQFVQRQGQWFHSRTTIYSDLAVGEAPAPVPCDHTAAGTMTTDAPVEDIPPATLSGPAVAQDAELASGSLGNATAAP